MPRGSAFRRAVPGIGTSAAPIAAFMLVLLMPLAAADTMDDVARRALEGNPGLSALREELAELRAEIPGSRNLKMIEISAGPSWYQDSSGGSPGGRVAISGPILPQLNFSASYDIDSGEGIFGLGIQPFGRGEDIQSWRDAISVKERRYREEEARVRSKAESFYVSMIGALARRDIAAARYAIAERKYRGDLFKYEYGLVSYKDFKESARDFQVCLQDMIKAERELVNLKKSALDLFGSDLALDSAAAWAISEEALARRIADIEASVATAKEPGSSELAQMQYDLRKLEREQAATAAWQPKFRFDATTESNFSVLDASIGVSFSLDQVKTAEKAKLARKILAKRQDVERKKVNLDYTVRTLELQARTLKEGISILRNALTWTEGAYAEARIQFNAGYLDKDGLESARLDMVDAGISLTQASAELLSALRDLEAQYPNRSAVGGN